MSLETEFVTIALEDLHHEAAVMKTDGYRFMQTHAVNTDQGVDLYYSFMKDGKATNLKVKGVTKDQPVPSITDLFLAAFVFENEARELFGVDMRDIAIDFAGAMYAPAEAEPMTFLSPEQKAARDKARKALAAKEAKAGNEGADEAPAGAKGGFVMTPERRERLNAKLATMSPEKVAKVEAALKAREAEAKNAAPAAPAEAKPADEPQKAARPSAGPAETADAVQNAAQRDEQLETKIALLDEAKAEKVRAALRARKGEAGLGAESPAPKADAVIDADLEAKIALLDAPKAQKVREALAAKAKRQATLKGGE